MSLSDLEVVLHEVFIMLDPRSRGWVLRACIPRCCHGSCELSREQVPGRVLQIFRRFHAAFL